MLFRDILRVAATQGGGPAPVPFSPLDLGADLIAWWDAEQPSTITDAGGGAVSSWKDVVAAYDLVQATGAAQPIYSATGFNTTHGGVTFDATDDYLRLGSVPAPFPLSTPVWIWWLGSQTLAGATATTRNMFAYGGANTNNSIRVQRTTSASVNRPRASMGDSVGANIISSASTVDFSGNFLLCQKISGTDLQIVANGTASTPAAGIPLNAAGNVTMGASSTGTAAGFQGGATNTILLTSATMSAGNITSLTNYLNARKA